MPKSCRVARNKKRQSAKEMSFDKRAREHENRAKRGKGGTDDDVPDDLGLS